MITTGAMVRIGKTLGNRMIDLKPTNEKLRIRSRRILRELAGVDDATAAETLARCDGQLKRALVVALAQVSSPPRRRRCSTPTAARSARRSSAHDGEGPAMSPPSRRLLLGVDGGGTSTVAWLAERRRPRARPGRAPGRRTPRRSGPRPRDWRSGRRSRAAFADAGLAPGPVAVGLPRARGVRPARRPDGCWTAWAEEARLGRPARPRQRRRPRGRRRHSRRLGPGRDRRHRLDRRRPRARRPDGPRGGLGPPDRRRGERLRRGPRRACGLSPAAPTAVSRR